MHGVYARASATVRIIDDLSITKWKEGRNGHVLRIFHSHFHSTEKVIKGLFLYSHRVSYHIISDG